MENELGRQACFWWCRKDRIKSLSCAAPQSRRKSICGYHPRRSYAPAFTASTSAPRASTVPIPWSRPAIRGIAELLRLDYGFFESMVCRIHQNSCICPLGFQYLYLYQRPDASVRIRTYNWGTTWDTTIATSGYTVGKTWLRVKRSNDTLYCYTSKNGSSYTLVYRMPNYWQSGEPGVMYSSAGTAGSVRFINIDVKKY